MPAPNDMIPTNDHATTPLKDTLSAFQNVGRGLTILCVVLGLYAFLVGVSVLRGALPLRIAHFLIAPVPLALALWFGFGFMQSPPKTSPNATQNASPNVTQNASPDFGLLVLCAGWALAALALLVPPSETNTSNVTAAVCGVLSLLCIVMGSVLSLYSWMNTVKN